METLTPLAEHRNCARHIYANWSKLHKGESFHFLFWKAVNCTCAEKFEEAMLEMKELSEDAYEDFKKIGVKHFCKAFISEHPLCPIIVNNISESFNSTLRTCRDKPIIDMLEDIRHQIMLRSCDRREALGKYKGKRCPKIMKQLDDMMKHTRSLKVIKASDDAFEVCDEDQRYVVLLNVRSCDCRAWQISGIPCKHALACIHFNRNDPADYVHEYYSTQICAKAYAIPMNPLSGESRWPKNPDDNLAPPKVRRMPGRPKKNRRKDTDENSSSNRMSKKGNIHKCCICQKSGHNKRGCPLKDNPPPRTEIPQVS